VTDNERSDSASGDPSPGPVLASFAHPDDAEIAAGGTLGRWAASGREVHLLVLTNGDRGSQDPREDRASLARTRLAEQEAAAAALGLAGFDVLSHPDGELANTAQVRGDIVRAIRRIRPSVVVTPDPSVWFLEDRYVNHADHRTAGAATVDAVFPAAGNPHFFAEQAGEGLSPWTVPRVYLAWTDRPNTYEDVSGFMDRKVAAVALHRSQVDMLGFFDQWIPEEAAASGRAIGVEHAEAFRVLTLE
jgi:LmbE family N-acetylglucosaminyl deacetylase